MLITKLCSASLGKATLKLEGLRAQSLPEGHIPMAIDLRCGCESSIIYAVLFRIVLFSAVKMTLQLRLLFRGNSNQGVDTTAVFSMYWLDWNDTVAGWILLSQCPYGGHPITSTILPDRQLHCHILCSKMRLKFIKVVTKQNEKVILDVMSTKVDRVGSHLEILYSLIQWCVPIKDHSAHGARFSAHVAAAVYLSCKPIRLKRRVQSNKLCLYDTATTFWGYTIPGGATMAQLLLYTIQFSVQGSEPAVFEVSAKHSLYKPLSVGVYTVCSSSHMRVLHGYTIFSLDTILQSLGSFWHLRCTWQVLNMLPSIVFLSKHFLHGIILPCYLPISTDPKILEGSDNVILQQNLSAVWYTFCFDPGISGSLNSGKFSRYTCLLLNTLLQVSLYSKHLRLKGRIKSSKFCLFDTVILLGGYFAPSSRRILSNYFTAHTSSSEYILYYGYSANHGTTSTWSIFPASVVVSVGSVNWRCFLYEPAIVYSIPPMDRFFYFINAQQVIFTLLIIVSWQLL